MKHNYQKHAEDIVKYFKEQLSEGALREIQEEDFDELCVMLESAISTSVLEATEQVADRLQEMAKGLRKGVEYFED